MRKIKLIWDFRGLHAIDIAKHHEIHLKDFLKTQNFETSLTGFEPINELHTTAFLVVEEAQMILIRDLLKPHRAQIFEG
jgi:hypothetical protein